MQIQSRDRVYINVVKGVAVFLMIWGHCIQFCTGGSFNCFSSPAFQWIYSFHMPLFMLISGYLFYFSFEKRDLKTLLIHRTQGMLQPIVFGSILNLILMKLPTLLLLGSANIFNGELLTGLFSLWFLWCVLSSGTAVALAGKLGRNWISQLIFLVIGIFFVALFPENDYHLFMYPYFVAGFYYGKYHKRLPGWVRKLALLSLIVFPVMLPDYHSYHLIYVTGVYVPDLPWNQLVAVNSFRWAIGFAGSLFVLTVVDMVFKVSVDRQHEWRVLRFLAKLGENSLAVYCISVSLLSHYLPKVFDRLLLMAGGNIFAQNMTVYNYLVTPALAVVYSLGLYTVVQLMKKLKLHKLIFGR